MVRKSIFEAHDLETMNEDDVAGILVRPFCSALGFSQGNPNANLRSQISLQYAHAFLGRKNPKKDPPLRGRPDFVCEVVSFGRWVVEAKAPTEALTLDVSHQAHTYATHPEIAAEFYVLTNGREFQLFRVGEPNRPQFQWLTSETTELLEAIRNILGPEAIKKRSVVKLDLGKPLAIGRPSSMRIVGGDIVYGTVSANVPMAVDMEGMRTSVLGNEISREAGGLIVAEVNVNSVAAAMDDLNAAMGFRPLHFKTSDEYVSTDIASPSLFQNLLSVNLPQGLAVPKTIFSPAGHFLFGVEGTCYTEAVGYLEGDHYLGTFVVEYDYTTHAPRGFPLPVPEKLLIRTEGRFDIVLTHH